MEVYLKTRERHKRERAKNQFAEAIGAYLYENTLENPTAKIKYFLRKKGADGANSKYTQYYTDLMVETKNMCIGENGAKLRKLYEELPLSKYSHKKTSSKNWHKAARGIREIYEMDQTQHVKHLRGFRKSTNRYIRREAEIGLVIFLGWRSLFYLAYLKRTVTLWQQIRIVEKLYDYHPVPDIPYLEKTLKNLEVTDSGKELLMRIIRKFDLAENVPYIIKNLYSKNYDVRETAITCLMSLELDYKALLGIKTAFFQVPDIYQKRQLIKIVAQYPMAEHFRFFRDNLLGDNPLVRLTAAQSLSETPFGFEVENALMSGNLLNPYQ